MIFELIFLSLFLDLGSLKVLSKLIPIKIYKGWVSQVRVCPLLLFYAIYLNALYWLVICPSIYYNKGYIYGAIFGGCLRFAILIVVQNAPQSEKTHLRLRYSVGGIVLLSIMTAIVSGVVVWVYSSI